MRTRSSSEAGFTLHELLMAAAASLIVFGGLITVMTVALRSEPRAAERSTEIMQGRAAMEQMTRELRQGATVISGTPYELSLITFVNSATCGGASSETARTCRVIYECEAGVCTRTEQNPDGTGTAAAVEVLRGISEDAVFSYSPTPTTARYVGVRIEFPSQTGDDSITLTDGVALRNPATAN